MNEQALADVRTERQRQDAKWGTQNHDPITYLAILTEEVDELAQAALHLRFGGPAALGVREEAVQVCAVALAIIECLDRNKWKENPSYHG
jgi:NTP pyrophosphatase (non-canonical NTP hydrolase)